MYCLNMAHRNTVLFVLSIILCLKFSSSVLEPYNPAARLDMSSRDDLIEQYFHLGFSQIEILAFLVSSHGIILSLRQLKRILVKRGLARRKHVSDLRQVISAIESELQGSGSNVGYRNMWLRLRNDHHIVVNKETVRHALRLIDPTGTERRLRHRLQRRQYSTKGPNYIWHIDGYDKLTPFGISIHGCIDGYSRRILWLEVGKTNSDPYVVAKNFVDCVVQVKGAPRIVRADCGTENVNVAAIQRFFRREADDAFAGEKSFIYGKSVSNQRIEAWWSQLRRGCTDWWITYFKDLRESGVYCDANTIYAECLRFCYIPVIANELQRVARSWNLHRIRPSENAESPAGHPDTLFFIPELTDTRDYKTAVDMDDIDISRELCCSDQIQTVCCNEFSSLAKLIMEDLDLQIPCSPSDAKELYLELITEIEKL